MYLKTLQTVLSSFLLCTLAFEDILHAYGLEMNEMTQRGKIQYQLLQERGSLPQYGDCWKNAIRKVDDGCKQLSEETQSEIALHLANCFLSMSGHEIYNCEADKKPNLRGICISTMSDRAFNVYTEFYTHTQNICYFLRGQIWHETIAENTVKLGKQLRDSSINLQELLKIQQESILLQEDMKEFFVYLTEKHKDFDVLTSNFKELQSWLLSEISWFDSFMFYFITSTMIMFFTSLKRTSEARFYMLITLTLNMLIERIIGIIISNKITNIFDSHQKYYYTIWVLRYLTIIILAFLLLYIFFNHKNYLIDNNLLLEKIYEKLIVLDKRINDVYSFSDSNRNVTILSSYSPQKCDIYKNRNECTKEISPKLQKICNPVIHKNDVKTNFSMRYNLRNRSATPEVGLKFI